MIGLSRTFIGRFFAISAQETPKVLGEVPSKPKIDLMVIPFFLFMSFALFITVHSLRIRKIELKNKSDFDEIPLRSGTPIGGFGGPLHEDKVTVVSPTMQKKLNDKYSL